MTARKDYRVRIFESCASGFIDAGPTDDVSAENRWGRAYEAFFRGWPPQQKDAKIIDDACGYGMLLRAVEPLAERIDAFRQKHLVCFWRCACLVALAYRAVMPRHACTFEYRLPEYPPRGSGNDGS